MIYNINKYFNTKLQYMYLYYVHNLRKFMILGLYKVIECTDIALVFFTKNI